MLKSIMDYLLQGEEYAKSARELAYTMNCNTRDITQMVQDERRHGAAICVSRDTEHPGYYMAETPADVETCCRQLQDRAQEIYKTRAAMLKTLKKMRADEAADYES